MAVPFVCIVGVFLVHSSVSDRADGSGADTANAGDLLSDRIIAMMKETGLPNGIGGVGYGEEDIPNLVKGTLPQQRLLVMSPKSVGEAELTQLFKDALRYW